MKYYRRILALVMTGAMVLAMAGCGGSGNSSSASVVTSSATTANASSADTSNYNAIINISINPEIELGLNADGKVIGIIYKNEDARTAYSELKLEGMTIKEASALLVKTANEKGYLKDGNNVNITYGINKNVTAAQSQEMMSNAREAIIGSLNEAGKDSALVINVENRGGEESKVCGLCYGVGEVICDGCGGKSYGNGKVKCDLCDGSGHYEDEHKNEDDHVNDGHDAPDSCNRCHGSGQAQDGEIQTCYVCKGTGKCINCGGSGQEKDEKGQMSACHACGGSGNCLQAICKGGTMYPRTISCPDCNGTGKSSGNGNSSSNNNAAADEKKSDTCYRCDGEKYVICNRCNGKLMKTCNRCDGSGIDS